MSQKLSTKTGIVFGVMGKRRSPTTVVGSWTSVLLCALMFPALVRPQPVRRLAADYLFKFAGAYFRNLEVGILLGLFRDKLESALVFTALYALHIKEENSCIHLLADAFCAGKDG